MCVLLLKPRRTLWGSWSQKTFKQWLIREESDEEIREGRSRNSSAFLGESPGSTSRVEHITISLSFSAELKFPTNGRC